MVDVLIAGEEGLARRVEKALFSAGFSVSRVLPEGIWSRLERERPSASVLVASTAASVMPLLEGAPTARGRGPIIASEAEPSDNLRHELIAAGALDCVLVSPPDRLIAKVAVVVRNLAGLVDDYREGPVVEVGDFRIEPSATEAYVGTMPLGVNRIQFRILSRLAHEPGLAMLSADLLEAVWGRQPRRDGVDKTVKTHIARLRGLFVAVAPDRTYLQTRHTAYGTAYALEERRSEPI